MIYMQLLFRTWNHIIPLAIVRNKDLMVGDVVEVRGEKYYINCAPGVYTPSKHKCKFYYCVRADENAKVTNKV